MKKTILYYLIFTLIYFILIFQTSMYFLSWGAKRNFIEICYIYFLSEPFPVEKSLFYILLNSFIWFSLLFAIFKLINYLKSSIGNK